VFCGQAITATAEKIAPYHLKTKEALSGNNEKICKLDAAHKIRKDGINISTEEYE